MLTLPKVVLVWACVACEGHGRRALTPSRQLRRSPGSGDTEGKHSTEGQRVETASRPESIKATRKPTDALARLFLGDTLTTAFNPMGFPAHIDGGKPMLATRSLASRRVFAPHAMEDYEAYRVLGLDEDATDSEIEMVFEAKWEKFEGNPGQQAKLQVARDSLLKAEAPSVLKMKKPEVIKKSNKPKLDYRKILPMSAIRRIEDAQSWRRNNIVQPKVFDLLTNAVVFGAFGVIPGLGMMMGLIYGTFKSWNVGYSSKDKTGYRGSKAEFRAVDKKSRPLFFKLMKKIALVGSVFASPALIKFLFLEAEGFLGLCTILMNVGFLVMATFIKPPADPR